MKCDIPERDWVQKLDQTVCRYKGVPYWVRPDQGGNIALYDLPGQRGPKYIKGTDPDFDISGLALGYINVDKTLIAYYLTRIPVRRTKQGTAPGAVRVEEIPNFRKKTERGIYSSTVIMTSLQGFVDMVMDKYPTVEVALETLRKAIIKTPDDIHQAAVSKNIALVIDTNSLVHVFYKQESVGWIAPGQNIVHVKKTDRHLTWVISKYLGHVFDWKMID